MSRTADVERYRLPAYSAYVWAKPSVQFAADLAAFGQQSSSALRSKGNMDHFHIMQFSGFCSNNVNVDAQLPAVKCNAGDG